MNSIILKIVIIILIFFSFSCNYLPEYFNKTNEKTIIRNSEYVNINMIYGLWEIISVKKNKAVTKCYECPKIQFNNNSSGKIIYPTKEEIYFTFTMQLYKNKIMFSFNTDPPYFDRNDFNYKINFEDNIEIFELNSIDGICKYTLAREKI